MKLTQKEFLSLLRKQKVYVIFNGTLPSNYKLNSFINTYLRTTENNPLPLGKLRTTANFPSRGGLTGTDIVFKETNFLNRKFVKLIFIFFKDTRAVKVYKIT